MEREIVVASTAVTARTGRRRAPLTAPAVGARVVLAVSVLVWFFLLWRYGAGPQEPAWATVVRHLAEGAFVGALCDWFAIWKVYSKARDQFPVLVRGVADTVVRDMVRVSEMSRGDQLRRKLDDPATRDAVVGYVRSQLPDRDAVRERVAWLVRGRLAPAVVTWLRDVDLRAAVLGSTRSIGLLQQPAVRHAVLHCVEGVVSSPSRVERLRKLLVESGTGLAVTTFIGVGDRTEMRRLLRSLYDEHWREMAVDWLAEVDMRPVLVAGGSDGLLADDRIRHAIAHSLRHATADAERAKQLHRAIVHRFGDTKIFLGLKAKTLLDWFLDPTKLQAYVSRLAQMIEHHQVGRPDPLRAALLQYVGGYLDGWHELSEGVRREAAARMLQHAVPSMLDGIADQLFLGLSETTVERVLDAAVTPELMERRLRSVVQWLRDGANTPSTQWTNERWAGATREYIGAWLDAWHALPSNVRERAATELVELFEPPAIDALVNLADDARNQILDTRWSGQLSGIAWIRSLFETIESLINGAGNLDDRASELLAQRLGSMGADGFVDMLEDRTRPSLDWIQFNGAVLGAGLGAVAGVLSVLAHVLR